MTLPKIVPMSHLPCATPSQLEQALSDSEPGRELPAEVPVAVRFARALGCDFRIEMGVNEEVATLVDTLVTVLSAHVEQQHDGAGVSDKDSLNAWKLATMLQRRIELLDGLADARRAEQTSAVEVTK